jgi:hypothetical protein
MYPAGRGERLADMRCRQCGKHGTLTRSGRTPSLNAQLAFLTAQPEPNGNVCAACGDNDHQAFECPLTSPARKRFPNWRIGR